MTVAQTQQHSLQKTILHRLGLGFRVMFRQCHSSMSAGVSREEQPPRSRVWDGSRVPTSDEGTQSTSRDTGRGYTPHCTALVEAESALQALQLLFRDSPCGVLSLLEAGDEMK